MINHTIVYRTAPQSEHKAAQELREAGARAYVGRDRTSKRNPFTGKLKAPAPGYVMSDRVCQIAFAKHVKGKLGTVRKEELARLYIAKPKRRADTEINPYKVGDAVLKGEVACTVVGIIGRFCRIEWDMLGKTQTQSIAYNQLKPG